MRTDANERQDEKLIALVAYPGMTPLDMIGPLRVLGAFNELRPEWRPVVVGERVAPLRTDTGFVIIPERSFSELPHPHILFVPGGGLPTLRAMSDPAMRAYVRQAADSAESVMSVCTGALILASVGLLRGRPATTHWAYRGILEQYGASYQRSRWVEDGKYLMSAGVSAGIDAALRLIERLSDEETMRRVQASVGYDPEPPFGFLDYDRLPLPGRALRTLLTASAPLVTRRPKRLTAAGG
jgi:transcriptional regulator GlxA family with amidase domain